MTIFWSSYSGGSTPKTIKSSSETEAKPSRPVKRTSDSMSNYLPYMSLETLFYIWKLSSLQSG